MTRKHNLDEVFRTLNKKNDCRITGSTILILSDNVWSNKESKYVPNPHKKHDLGNGSWGRIDFLVNHNDYSILHVDSF